MTRDNFSATTKVALAKRAGFRCSYPDCNVVTIGPSSEGAAATANTGEAAHISAASGGPGARRYRPELTPEQRSSIDNGIWCCGHHARLVDTDETTYTIPMLKKWRALAEHRAQLRQAYGDITLAHREKMISVGLAPNSLTLLAGTEMAEQVGIAVHHTYLSEILGQDVSHVVRDFLIEYVRNAFSHGCAVTAEIKFEANLISVVDDGAPFQISALAAPESRGGGQAYRALLKTRRLGCVSSRFNDRRNHLHIPIILDVEDLPRSNPCAIALNRSDLKAGRIDVSKFSGCDRVFVVAPPFAVYSDGPVFALIIKKLAAENPNIVLIVPDASAGVIEHYRQLLPGVLIAAW